MEHTTVSSSDRPGPVTRSSSSSIGVSSPATSFFSRGHSTCSSGSSVASSPIPQESLDLYVTASRLEDVREEPQERDEFDGYTLVNDRSWSLPDDKFQISSPGSPTHAEYSLGDQDAWSTTSSQGHHFKRPRSLDHQPALSMAHRFSNRFGSISRRWRNRSSPGPQLSITTHANSSASRSGSFTSFQVMGPALSAISQHESHLPPSPICTTGDEYRSESGSEPIPIEPHVSEPELDCVRAATPLLPPLLTELSKKDSPIQSPLQSPSIAPTPAVVSTRTSFDAPPPISYLPSPPLSTRPSIISMHARSRANTATTSPYAEFVPMPRREEFCDPWDGRLGHANFNIHPEPYEPQQMDLDGYTEFRANWDQARTNYAKHLARTAEHYGSTSKVYKLTEEKWTSIDDIWKRHHAAMTKVLAPVLARVSGDAEAQDSAASSAVLEKPMTKVVVPIVDDKGGKFPLLGDGEIVGPMSVGPPLSPPKRHLLKFLSNIFGGRNSRVRG